MPFIKNPGHSVSLGGLSLVENGAGVDHAAGFRTEISADGTTWGNPEVAISTLISQLGAGDIVATDHVGNRQPVLMVRLSAPDGVALVAGDTALGDVVGDEPCELIWTAPDVFATPTVIDVVWSRMDHQWDDLDSLRIERVWQVTLSALPWPRSAGKIVTPAVATGAMSVADDGSSKANWAVLGPTGATLSVVSGAVTSSYDGTLFLSGTELQRTAVINTSADKFLGIDWKSSVPVSAYYFYVEGGGSAYGLTEARRAPAPAAGFTRSWFQVPDAVTSVDRLRFYTQHRAQPAGTQTLGIDQVVTAATLPAIGTAKQFTRTIIPGGNMPAQGDVVVQHPTEGLGHVAVFSHPIADGYSPALSPYLDGAVTNTGDNSAVSGTNTDITSIRSYIIPVAAIPPGDHHLWGRILRNVSGTVTISGAAYTAVGPSLFTGASQPFSVSVPFGSAYTWAMVPLARLSLPPSRVGVGGFVQIDISGSGVFVDELWTFAMDRGTLTVLDCGKGAPVANGTSNRLRITAPSLTDPNGSIEVGTRADFADLRHPNPGTVLCDQSGHEFDPAKGTQITVVTAAGDTAITEASASFAHYPRWRAEAGA